MFPFLSVAIAEETASTEKTNAFLDYLTGTVFKKLINLDPTIWGVIAVLVLFGVIFFISSRNKTKWTTRMLANAALTIALSFILSFIRLYKMPQGGSITLASMVPLFLFAYAYGTAPGMIVGLCYGFMQWMQDGFYMVHPVEAALDYMLAFAMLGLAGLSRKLPDEWGLALGCVIGALGRAFCAVLSGIVFFGMYAPEGQSVLLYSLGYNGLYLIPETLVCLVICAIPQIRQLAKKLTLK